MPNFMAHNHIAATIFGEDQPDIGLGSMLPDFVGMYLARHPQETAVKIHGIDAALDRGIQLHIATDKIFNGMEEVPRVTAPLASDLEEKAGIPGDAARLTAHFAADLLLDTALNKDTIAVKRFKRVGDRALKRSTALSDENFGDSFTTYVKSIFRYNTPRHYDDPSYIALIAQHRLQNRNPDRPERFFAKDMIKPVGEVIRAHVEPAGELGLAAMTKTISVLRIRQDLLDRLANSPSAVPGQE